MVPTLTYNPCRAGRRTTCLCSGVDRARASLQPSRGGLMIAPWPGGFEQPNVVARAWRRCTIRRALGTTDFRTPARFRPVWPLQLHPLVGHHKQNRDRPLIWVLLLDRPNRDRRDAGTILGLFSARWPRTPQPTAESWLGVRYAVHL